MMDNSLIVLNISLSVYNSTTYFISQIDLYMIWSLIWKVEQHTLYAEGHLPRLF